MDLTLSPDQAAVDELFRGLFATESTPEVVRAHEALGFAPSLWRRVWQTGAPSLAVGEAAGGGGAGLLEAVIAVEAAGFHLAPIPLIEHLVATRLLERLDGLAAAGTADEPPLLAEEDGMSRAGPDGAAHLATAVDAATIYTLALHPVHAERLRLVPAGAVAGAVLACRDTDVILVAGPPPMAAAANSAGLPIGDRDLRGAEVIATGPAAVGAYQRAVDEWRLLTAAALVGLTDAALRMGVTYVSQRHQFGVPIGSYQAIQHGLAEFPGPLSGAQLLVRRAAWRVDQRSAAPSSAPTRRMSGAPAPDENHPAGTAAALDPVADRLAVDAPIALHFATELARNVTARVLHYHGGYGVMAETDIQLHYRRARGWPAQLGDPEAELDLVADRLYGVAG